MLCLAQNVIKIFSQCLGSCVHFWVWNLELRSAWTHFQCSKSLKIQKIPRVQHLMLTHLRQSRQLCNFEQCVCRVTIFECFYLLAGFMDTFFWMDVFSRPYEWAYLLMMQWKSNIELCCDCLKVFLLVTHSWFIMA